MSMELGAMLIKGVSRADCLAKSKNTRFPF